MLEKLAKLQEKYPVFILLIALVVTLFFGNYALNLETDASFDSMYRDDSDVTKYKNLVSNEFGSTDTLFILISLDESVEADARITDIRDPQIFKVIEELATEIEKETFVTTSFSIVNVLKQEYGKLPTTFKESKEMLAGLNQDTTLLVSKDATAANLIVPVDISTKPGSIEKIENKITQIVEDATHPSGVNIILTGQPTLLNRIMHLLINDNLTTIGIALLFVFVVLWFFFKSPFISIVTIIPTMATLIWLAGTLTLLDIRINMMIAAVGAMMVGMGVDYGIHIAHAFHHNVKKAKKDPLKRTVKSVGGALFASALTTTAGFIAMLLGVSPSSKIQGTVLAIGIAYAFITTIVILPCLLIIQRRFVYSHIDEIIFKIGSLNKKQSEKKLQKFLTKLGTFQTRVPKTVLIGVIIFTVLIVPGSSQLRFDTDNANWIPDGDPVIDAFNDIVNYFGGTEQMNLLVIFNPNALPEQSELFDLADLREPEILNKVAALDHSLETLDYINFITSPTDGILAQEQRIPNDLDRIKEIVNKNPEVRSYFNEDYSVIRLSINSDSFGDPKIAEDEKHYYEILNEIESIPFPEGVEVVAQGGPAQFVELSASLQKDAGLTTMIGFLFIITIASLLYRSLTVGLLAFFPIIFSILWTVGIMGYIGLPFTVLTSGMLAIVMGMGIDFSIHLIHATKEWLKEGHSITESVVHSLTSTGEAIFIATTTTVIGFLSLVLASLLVTQRLGMTLAIAIAMSFLACIIIVPAVLTVEHQMKTKRKKNGGGQN